MRFGRKLDLLFRERARKPSSKYRIAARSTGCSGADERTASARRSASPDSTRGCSRSRAAATADTRWFRRGSAAATWCVKLYGRKRPWFPTLARSFGHRFLVAKTGLGAQTRRDTEARLLRLWRQHGFAVPEVLELSLPEPESRPYLVLERVGGRDRADASCATRRCRSSALEAGIARFAAECCRRHALAERLREPGLVHAHPASRTCSTARVSG